MIRFFKENDIFRLSFSVIIFLGFRIFFLVYDTSESEQAIFWLALGERLNEGSQLYSELWTGTAPLSAVFYALVVKFFGESQLALEVIGSVLCLFQLLYLNLMLEIRRVYNIQTQLIPFVFAFFVHLHPSFALASPVLLGSCFLLPVLNHIFSLNERSSREDSFILIGIYLSIAALFHLGFVLFLLLVLVAYIFSGFSDLRGLIFSFMGIASVWSLFLLYFLFRGSVFEVINQFVLYRFHGQKILYSDLTSVVLLSGTIAFFSVLGYLSAVSSRQFLNYQQTCQFLMLVWMVCGIVFHWFSGDLSVNQSFLLVFPGTYFVVNQLTMLKRAWVLEVYGWVFVLLSFSVMLLNGGMLGKENILSHYAQAENLTGVKNKNVLVLSRKFGGIKDNRVSTKYFDWNLTQTIWMDLDSYEKILALESSIWSDMPDLVFDPEGVAVEAFEKIPSLAREFVRVSPSLWHRKPH